MLQTLRCWVSKLPYFWHLSNSTIPFRPTNKKNKTCLPKMPLNLTQNTKMSMASPKKRGSSIPENVSFSEILGHTYIQSRRDLWICWVVLRHNPNSWIHSSKASRFSNQPPHLHSWADMDLSQVSSTRLSSFLACLNQMLELELMLHLEFVMGLGMWGWFGIWICVSEWFWEN